MQTYVVLLLKPNVTVSNRIETVYPEHHRYNDTTFFIRDVQPVTEQIALRIGIKGDDRINNSSGVVLKLGDPLSYSGFTNRSLWDWLGAA